MKTNFQNLVPSVEKANDVSFASRVLAGAAALCLGLTAFAPASFAGFEWVASDAAQTAPAAPLSPSTPNNVPAQIAPALKDIAQQQVRLAPPPPQQQVQVAPQQSAQAPANQVVASLQGFGNNVPLVVALRQIVPAGSQLAFGQGVELSEPISWQGGKNWEDTLLSVTKPLNLVYEKNGSTVIVRKTGDVSPQVFLDNGFTPVVSSAPVANPALASSVSPVQYAPTAVNTLNAPAVQQQPVQQAAPAAIQAVAAQPLAQPAPAPAQFTPYVPPVASAPQAASNNAPAPVPSAPVTIAQAQPVSAPSNFGQPAPATNSVWLVEEGKTLRSTLNNWGKTAGWNVVWNSDRDYTIQAAATFNGDFQTATSNLLRAFARAKPPVMATFYRNRTVLIQTDVDQ